MIRTPPSSRLRTLSPAPVRTDGDYVLYWMHQARRSSWSFALDQALALAQAWGKPLLVLEALDLDYPHASRRFHAFALQGMADNARAFERAGIATLPFVERSPGEGRGLVRHLARRACVVVTDRSPFPFLRSRVERLASLPVRALEVDGLGLLPVSAIGREHKVAWGFRKHLGRELPRHPQLPSAQPLRGLELPRMEAPRLARWPRWEGRLTELPLDAEVGELALRGGSAAASRRLRDWLERGLVSYERDRAHPDRGSSGLSPWLHWGHLSPHEVAERVRRAGGCPVFQDQLVTWRELSIALVERVEEPWRYESLPAWARQTLDEHRGDPREELYSLEELERAQTEDPIWNAAQRQLRVEGRIHNSLRMLWGKRVLAWSESPEQAWERLFHLNDRWAIDGRDPNSIAGIGWCFGRFDRAWGPERPIYGKLRTLSSASSRRKWRMRAYLERFRDDPSPGPTSS